MSNLAKELGVNKNTITNVKKSLGIVGEMTEEQEKEVAKRAVRSQDIRNRNGEKMNDLTSKSDYKSKVRRIDKKDASAMRDILQDAKERYVRNEKIIERLQHEIDQFEVFTIDNANGSLSSIPQLATMVNYIKLNISLRTQIVQLEQALEITDEETEDPFR